MTGKQPTDALPLDAYVRVSAVGERGGEQSYGSPTVQREAEERWAGYKQERIAKVWVDDDQSGGTQDRPGLNAAIDRALRGETGGIVAYNISRFSRFTEGGLTDLRRLREAGARLVFVQEDIELIEAAHKQAAVAEAREAAVAEAREAAAEEIGDSAGQCSLVSATRVTLPELTS